MPQTEVMQVNAHGELLVGSVEPAPTSSYSPVSGATTE